ncbi:FAD binding domain-containing protein [Acuticoccus sp. MNP-M23]|uniref:FAD binding domain-containing protein n=1 Tax=Acuticoccus sp. MNP-M23 TaxID=3072793 RepID=UPI002815E058|nr:FAD binding domain-containing protein [Acuticoccus sp. MNP-M23]WMS44039.1 FAD binding domain-containing protein [Acuticoccus sp. MNP-M23]
MSYHCPRTVDEALAALCVADARILAGGTDFYAALGDRPLNFPVVDITRIDGLRAITPHEGGWRLGAATTWTDIVRAPLPPAFDGLKAAAREVGAVQIQNTGTIAGNLCNASPAADGVPALLALGASIEVAGSGGLRTEPLSAFLTGVRQTSLAPGEMVTAILIPPHGAAARGAFVKLGARRYLVISIAMAAAVLETENGHISAARVAVGACSAVAARLPALEAALAGTLVADAPCAVAADHFADLAPIGDVRASAPFRMEAALELVRRTLKSAGEVPS